MVRDSKRLRSNYFKSASWRTDILSCLPTDFVYFIWAPKTCDSEHLPCPVIIRANRLFRLPRMLEFFDRTETKTGYPNVFRICKVVFAILILIHWNSCFYFAISYVIGFGTDSWVYNITGPKNSTLSRQYIYCFYWSTLTLTTIGEYKVPVKLTVGNTFRTPRTFCVLFPPFYTTSCNFDDRTVGYFINAA